MDERCPGMAVDSRYPLSGFERIIANGQARGDEGRKWGPGRVIPKGTGHHHKKNIEKGENFTGRGEGR